MTQCICSGCTNLKSVLNEQGVIELYECEFGFPSEACENCEEEECDLTCIHYSSDSDKVQPRILKCKGCGRELEQVCRDGEEGEVYCVDCYLKNI